MQEVKSKTDILRFLELAETIPIVDVRSPSEFTSGHIPGAFNIPLFDDSERAEVGTVYKNEGRTNAILRGLGLAGPSFRQKLETALKISKNNKLLVHCWRGGMRSEAMAWLFRLGGINAEVLEGGYKSYRHHVLESLAINRKMIVLGGLTGSGKTHILDYLKHSGEKVIDLEGMANHKGSAFGALGQPMQPTSEYFANLLFDEWKQVDPEERLWIEDESRNIGMVFMPDAFYSNIRNSPSIILLMDVKTRLPRLIEEYSGYPPSQLEASVRKITKRLGGDNANVAIEAIRKGDFARAIEITLGYYDKAYMYGLKANTGRNMIYVETDTDDISINALKILEASKGIKW